MASQLTTTRAPATPVTPAAQKQQQQPLTPTGSWKHPKFDEITRRQYATTFDDRNVRTIFVNAAALALSWVALNSTPKLAILRFMQTHALRFLASGTYGSVAAYSINALRLLFVYNILRSLYPLLLRYYPDDVADIPLTPSQRYAMGLDPSISTPQTQTPGSAFASPNYVTPPRYQKATPRSGSFSRSQSRERGSPLSDSPRSSFGVSTATSTGSPLLHKVISGERSGARSPGFAGRTLSPSFGGSSSGGVFGARSASPSLSFLDSTTSYASSTAPSTPTPGGASGKASVGLNNKWLYEKRRDGRGSGMFS